MPVGAEAVQRGLGLRNPGVLARLFFVNTLGSAMGALATGGWALFHWGLQATMLAAVAANALAAVLLLALAARRAPSPSSDALAAPEGAPPETSHPLRLAFLLGAASLGYEMVLLRLFALRHEPLPYTFATVVTGFLLTWSAGVKTSEDPARRLTLPRTLAGLALTLALIPAVFLLDSQFVFLGPLDLPLAILARFPYFFPSLLFGHAFGLLVASRAESWGEHVGSLSAWNTAGCCLGVLLTTLVGFHLDVLLLPVVLAGVVLVGSASMPRRVLGSIAGALGLAAGGLVDVSGMVDGSRYYYGHDGVIAVFPDGNLLWDGLWHSRFSDGKRRHVGSNNWLLATAPVLAHDSGEVRDVCVIGLGAGITAGLLARLDTVERVQVYDITQTLRPVLEDHPVGSLGVLANPKVDVRWEDARMGLALRPGEKYDVIQTQPLYLKQAGSGLLNSVEFFRLIRDRLKPGGVFCLYSNGTPEQAFVLRQTAAKVFPHRATISKGYLMVLSNEPLGLDGASLARRYATGGGGLWDEIRSVPSLASATKTLDLVDGPDLSWGDGRLVVTDDLPLVEYPYLLAEEVARLY
jgi:spermidine synthase